MSKTPHGGATIVPCLRYHDAPAAIDWLCRAFGFEKQLVVPDEDGRILQAQLTLGNGMIMLCSMYPGEWGKLMAQPEQIGGRETQTSCVFVADPDAHHARAIAAGAQILVALKDNHYGGRSYSCRDVEGHIWTFGSYDPWAQ
jgi:uncharacterized glyoxalase superfamily protein PhnB